MLQEKLTQVTDYLQGSIPLTRLEKGVLSTQAVNRLHNVLQNSSAYLTYPSNRHSRLAHSLGVLHFAGEILSSAFVNASQEDQTRLLQDLSPELEALVEDARFRDDVTHQLPTYDAVRKLRTLDCGPLKDPVIRRKLPGGLSQPSDSIRFALLFQAIRLAGLLHDLGHPPFSHAVESALATLFREIGAKVSPEIELTVREKTLLRILERYKTALPAIHEGIGNDLAVDVLRAALHTFSRDDDEIFLGLLSSHLALAILNDRSRYYRSLHLIVAGTLDADRLDYVARDALMTGFADGGFRYTRLLNSVRLKYDEGDALFLPSVQALSIIESFFESRINSYIYIVYHHRVAKTDGLLREAILGLGRLYLSSNDVDSPREGNALPTDISGLWRILDQRARISPAETFNAYMQWDDAWLLTVLRRDYFARQGSDSRGSRELLDIQLEEFLSNRKYYYSLFKRPDSFAPIDEAFLDELGKEYDFRPLLNETASSRKSSRASSATPTEELWQLVHEYHHGWWNAPSHEGLLTQRTRVRERQGFFLPNLSRMLTALGFSHVALVKSAAVRLAQENGLLHVFVVEKPLLAGVTGEFELLRGDEVITLRQISELTEQLNRRLRFFPGFFVYLYREQGFSESELSTLRLTLARLLALEFHGLISSLRNKEATDARESR